MLDYTVGNKIEGLRVANFYEVKDDRICYWFEFNDCWHLYLPGCGVARLKLHEVETFDDGTITVSPSILITGHDSGKPVQRHGFLERGVWREV